MCPYNLRRAGKQSWISPAVIKPWLSDYLESYLISVDGNEVLASKLWVLKFSTMWWEQDYTPRGVRKMQVCLIPAWVFRPKFNNYRIQSRKFLSFGVNIKSRKNAQNHWCAHTIPCNKTSKSREKISAGNLEFLRLYIRENREIKTLMPLSNRMILLY